MEVENLLKNISKRQQKHSELTDIVRPLDIDVGLMTAWDPDSISLPKAGADREAYFKDLARNNAQVVMNHLYSFGEEVLKLPEAKTILPRSKPIPKPKPPTKWEKFAQEKDIKSNKRRDKLVYDEETKRWVPRFGYKKAQNEREKNWVTEVE